MSSKLVAIHVAKNFPEDEAEKLEAVNQWLGGNSTVSLSSVASFFYPDDEDLQGEFIEHASEFEVPQEIEVFHSSLPSLVVYKINTGTVKVKFEADDIDRNIIVNREQRWVQIRNIPEEQIALIPGRDQEDD